MNKLLKKENSPLKFDTSSANINCFINGKSKPKSSQCELCNHSHKSKRKSRLQRQKQMEFQDKAFLSSVVCKILNENDCQGITQLIDNMEFPANSSSQTEINKETHRDEIEQQKISQIFRNFQPFNKTYFPLRNQAFIQNQQYYQTITPIQYNKFEYSPFLRQQKLQCQTTIHSSFGNSMVPSPREGDPVRMMDISLYAYNYYSQGNYAYQRQPQRKKSKASGQQVQQYKIVAEKIELDGRTTLMVRHIPNKYSEQMLFEEIGRNHRMKINFLYLPIDNYNSCNVGYAFVNFIHTKFINEFYKEFNGRRWDRFNSEKICQLAYARIQGTTNLMDHFQNYSGGQMRGKNSTKCEEKRGKSSQFEDNSTKDISLNVDHPRIEEV